MLPGLAWGPPPPWGPKQPNEAPALQQANAPAGQAFLALCWRLSCAGGPPNDLHQPKNEPLRFSSGPPRQDRSAAAPERPEGL
jgi:hypothetical protein